MILAIHQPNYLPWMGFFFKLYLSDYFLFLDDVPFSRKSYTKRTNIKRGLNDPLEKKLSVAVVRVSRETVIQEIEVSPDFNVSTHQNQLYESYHREPYFDSFYPILHNWLEKFHHEVNLSSINIYLIKNIADMLGVTCQYERTSNIDCPNTGKGQYVRELILRMRPEYYISGQGARVFQEDELRDISCVTVYQNILDFYRRTFEKQYFDPSRSIVESLFRVGPDQILELFSLYRNHLGI